MINYQKLQNKFIRMQNPEIRGLSPQVMYNYQDHRNIPWNEVQYQPLKEYLDPVKQMTERKYLTQKKGEPDTKYKTRRGFYMDYHLKVSKLVPEPSHYNIKDPFDQEFHKKKGMATKIDNKLIKYTYIERIEMQQKNRKKPAPGAYNLNKTEDNIQEELKNLKTKKRSVGQKKFFYEDLQYLSNSVPGMGLYNPHLSVTHLKSDKKDHKFWTQKHIKMSQSFHKKRLSEPAPGSYSPCPLDVTTFDRIKTADLIQKRKKNIKQTGFGTDAKFTYERPNKKIIKQQRPAAPTYNTMIEWKGKNSQSKKNNWINSISTGFNKSVYNG